VTFVVAVLENGVVSY